MNFFNSINLIIFAVLIDLFFFIDLVRTIASLLLRDYSMTTLPSYQVRNISAWYFALSLVWKLNSCFDMIWYDMIWKNSKRWELQKCEKVVIEEDVYSVKTSIKHQKRWMIILKQTQHFRTYFMQYVVIFLCMKRNTCVRVGHKSRTLSFTA